MQIEMLYAKVHRATVTAADLHYEGSLTMDRHLMDEAGLRPYQSIEVYNITNGNRFHTYVIEGDAHSGVIQINGAAAHLANVGDLVIIASYCSLTQAEAEAHTPRKVFVDSANRPIAEKPAVLPV